MDVLQALCSVPTAPFAERFVTHFLVDFINKRKELTGRVDRFSNLLIELKGAKRSRSPRWVFTAHTDHPGLVSKQMLNPRTLQADFRGGVKTEYVRGARVKFFTPTEEIPGQILTADSDDPTQSAPNHVTVQVSRPVPPGSPGMFDQGTGRYKNNRFYSRVCDDLAGGAAALQMLDELRHAPPASPIAVLFTRAEEVGFVGCIAACQSATLLKKSDRIIAIECSSVQPHAPQGAGVIIRVGDRTSIFNSSLTYFLGEQAQSLAKTDPNFKYQRALMQGGTCEATVYDVWKYLTASLCVPLGNYHNMDVKRKKIAPEFIDVSDWQNMVKLFVQLARHGHEYKPGHGPLKKRILQRYHPLAKTLSYYAGSYPRPPHG